uniref:RING-type domain-containing protein n=2 Tax=Dendroctonus ponderosae TaxID=77166 RepID=A0AAR5Q7H9_DENPD
MDNGDSKIMMLRPRKSLISELNSCITCGLCKGYFIDATTIIECLHTFCRSCIVRYLNTHKYCPICDVQVHKSKPLLNIRQDKTLQALVYKLVPRLYQDEAKRRKAFYEANPTAKPSPSEQEISARFDYILAPDESVDFTLSYTGSCIKPRYIRCSSAVSISHLKKLIHAKYELTDLHKVDVFFKEDNLDYSLTLIDVAYIYSWKRKNPLDLTYKIYESRVKKAKLECSECEDQTASSTNWKEVQLRISENGEMSITGIQESGMLQLLEATENFKSEVVITESKVLETAADAQSGPGDSKVSDASKKPLPELQYIGKAAKLNVNGASIAAKTSADLNHTPSTSSSSAAAEFKVPSLPFPKPVELSASLNLNSELSVMPLSSTSCVSLSSCGGTTTVFSTISKSMCSTKSDNTNSHAVIDLSTENKTLLNVVNPAVEVNSVLKQSNSLKRRCDEARKTTPDVPTKQPKPTILNHSLGLTNMKKHSKYARTNGELRHADVTDKSLPILTITPDSGVSKPTLSSQSLNYAQLNRQPKPAIQRKSSNSGNVPCYMSKLPDCIKVHELNGGRPVVDFTLDKSEGLISTHQSPGRSSSGHVHTPIITPAHLSHRQHLSALKQSLAENPTEEQVMSQNDLRSASQNVKDSEKPADAENQQGDTPVSLCQMPTMKTKPSTSIGYKTLRDPPKSWNSQINSQIARVNQNAKAQQLANAAAAAAQCATGNGQGRSATDLKTVRPAKFFKGRNMPRYLGNPASGVKPMYQVQVSPEKSKEQTASKPEKSEIKKHSIVKIDPKTLKPISEKAPDTVNLSNIGNIGNLESAAPHSSEESRSGSPVNDLKISLSSVPIFNPLKLQQTSPRSGRKSPRSPHSPKTKPNSTIASTTTTASNSSLKQQRDKTNLTFTRSNPFIPNLGSPTLNPNQFLYPAGGYPSYDPRFMAACHSLWYSRRMAEAGLVPPALPAGFGLNMSVSSLSSTNSQNPFNAGVGPKYSTASRAANPASQRSSNSKSLGRKVKEFAPVKNEKSLEVILEKINQNKVKEMMDVKGTDGKAAATNGLVLQRPPSQPSNGDLEAAEVHSKKTESTGHIKESCKSTGAAAPSSEESVTSHIIRDEPLKPATIQNDTNNSANTNLKTAHEEDGSKREERLRDESNEMKAKESAVFKVAASKSGETVGLKREKAEGHSENGISARSPEISKTDVNDNGTVSTCEDTEKVVTATESSNEQKTDETENNSAGSEETASL